MSDVGLTAAGVQLLTRDHERSHHGIQERHSVLTSIVHDEDEVGSICWTASCKPHGQGCDLIAMQA